MPSSARSVACRPQIQRSLVTIFVPHEPALLGPPRDATIVELESGQGEFGRPPNDARDAQSRS